MDRVSDVWSINFIIRKARTRAQAILSKKLLEHPSACFDAVTVFEILSHEFGLDSEDLEQEHSRKNKAWKSYVPKKELDKDLLLGVVTVTALALSQDSKIREQINNAYKAQYIPAYVLSVVISLTVTR